MQRADLRAELAPLRRDISDIARDVAVIQTQLPEYLRRVALLEVSTETLRDTTSGNSAQLKHWAGYLAGVAFSTGIVVLILKLTACA